MAAPATAASAITVDAAAPDSGPTREGLTLNTSVRCSECHDKMRVEWETSGHARSFSSPSYQAARSQAGRLAARCDRCHAPLIHYAGAKEPAAREGVGCDVCHNIQKVDTSAKLYRFEVTAYDMVKYGPICDAKPHYFHRMGCSPLHEEAELCGACHQLVVDRPDGPMPVYTTYADWKAGPFADDGIACQVCHMPGEKAEVAEGSPVRSGVGHHGFFGGKNRLRQRTVAMSVVAVAKPEAGRLVVDVVVRNAKAGHPIPAGSPARRIALTAKVLDRAGQEQGPAVEHVFGRVLVDDAGKVVPFYRATRQARDNRIAARGSATVRFELAAPVAGTLEVALVWRSHAPEIARALGVSEIDEDLMAQISIPLPAASARRKPLRGKVKP